MRHQTTALVPLRALGVGKSRLAPELRPDQRAALAEAMFNDVVDALAGSAVVEVVVAAGNGAAVAAARARGLEVIADPDGTTSLDAALAGASAAIGPRESLLIVAADLPLLTTGDVAAALSLSQPVVVAPTHDGGTGALLRCPSNAMGTAYGPGSAARHRELAEVAGYGHATAKGGGWRHDVDTWADLLRVAESTPGRHTASVLDDLLGSAAPAG